MPPPAPLPFHTLPQLPPSIVFATVRLQVLVSLGVPLRRPDHGVRPEDCTAFPGAELRRHLVLRIGAWKWWTE